jgi:superfamily II DNA/RNA helicase
MAWPDKLKLNKRLTSTLTEVGYLFPKEVQSRSLSRINGGQDLIVTAPDGSGKTTTYILAVLNRFRYDFEGVPRVLILVPDKEQVLAVTEQFDLLNKNKSILIVGLYAAPGIETQMNALADGADIVIATPDRARAIYLKLGLNLNKIELFIVDDADLIVKQGLQLPVAELANSITKSQRLVFTSVVHDRLHKMIDPFMKLPTIVEVEEIGEAKVSTYPQVLYHVPNFGTKLNLLNLFMQDEELFTKVALFVNTRQTAETICKSLKSRLKDAVAILNPWSFELSGLSGMDEFKNASGTRILVIVNDNQETLDLDNIPFLIHFELPEDKQTFLDRIVDHNPEESNETMALTFATDLELTMVKKIEQETGQKIPSADLPEDLIIEKERKSSSAKKQVTKDKDEQSGEAFHQKKASNAKTYNYGAGKKAKMTNKKKHS